MPGYRPLPYPKEKLAGDPDVSGLLGEFAPFTPDRQYNFPRGEYSAGAWDIVKPKTAPPVVGNLPEIIRNLVNATWKFAEPKENVVAGQSGIVIGQRSLPPTFPKAGNLAGQSGVVMGQRGDPGFQPSTMNKQYERDTNYHPQERPTKTNLGVEFPNRTAIASDWGLFNNIERTNAVTFRGDGRSPAKVILEARGFHPPISRINDQAYIENNVYEEFRAYYDRRYHRPLTKEDFMKALNTTVQTPAVKKRLVDYMMWRQITCREAAHLGRMVSNEFLKGYISTSRSIDTSMGFATAKGKREGWLYVTVIHSGFLVPQDQNVYWGSEEGEIAHWGAVPADQIVGFVKVAKNTVPTGPIFMRSSFRDREPEAFEFMFKVMSGIPPPMRS